jgi:hypothetical protein
MSDALLLAGVCCRRVGYPMFLFLFVLTGTVSPTERLPLRKSKIEIGEPASTPPELDGYDARGDPVYWDPKPRVVPQGDGKYAFKWTGHKGQELTVMYTRPDVVDVVVEASLTSAPEASLSYSYLVRNLASSKQNLGGFEVRAFTSALQPQGGKSIFTTNPKHIRDDIVPIRDGLWVAFAPIRDQKQIRPGQTEVFVILSPHPPAVVECRATAETLRLKGAGEEMPFVLEQLILGRDAWPRGWTIGPDERLAKMSLDERLNYLTDNLPKMLELGWIENSKVMQWYEANLKAGKTSEVRARAEADFKRNLITSEVLALMTYLTR